MVFSQILITKADKKELDFKDIKFPAKTRLSQN